jgi:tight adherence protein B
MMIPILIIGGILAIVILVIGIAVSIRSESALVEDRLNRYIQDDTPIDIEGDRVSPLGEWFDDRLEGSAWGTGISKELARADLKLKPAEYIAIMVIMGVGAGFIAWFLGGRSLIIGIIGAAVGAYIPRLYVRRQQSQRLIRFGEQLPDMLNLMVNGLRAGYSTVQAMEAVGKELPPPISDEFRRVVQEIQLGVPMEQALDNLLRRIPSDDLDLTITAINVQREVGGNLAEILDTISHTIRERVRIKGEIRVLTTQVMYSGRFLAMMPLFIALTLWFLNRPYMMMFFDPDSRMIGIPLLAIGVIMIMSGYFVMVKIADIEV